MFFISLERDHICLSLILHLKSCDSSILVWSSLHHPPSSPVFKLYVVKTGGGIHFILWRRSSGEKRRRRTHRGTICRHMSPRSCWDKPSAPRSCPRQSREWWAATSSPARSTAPGFLEPHQLHALCSGWWHGLKALESDEKKIQSFSIFYNQTQTIFTDLFCGRFLSVRSV